MKTQRLACVLAVGIGTALPAASDPFLTFDTKTIHPTQCVASGANTTTAELSFGSFGVSNPGTTDETITCPLPIDIEEPWDFLTYPTPVHVHWRTGSVPGRIVCTLFSGSIATQDGAVTSYTFTSDTLPANSITSETAGGLAEPNWSDTTPPAPVASVVCLLGPKTKIGGFFMFERHATNR
jgi:hypothetical protein